MTTEEQYREARRWADDAEEVAEAIRPLIETIDGETWVVANALAEDLRAHANDLMVTLARAAA